MDVQRHADYVFLDYVFPVLVPCFLQPFPEILRGLHQEIAMPSCSAVELYYDRPVDCLRILEYLWEQQACILQPLTLLPLVALPVENILVAIMHCPEFLESFEVQIAYERAVGYENVFFLNQPTQNKKKIREAVDGEYLIGNPVA